MTYLKITDEQEKTLSVLDDETYIKKLTFEFSDHDVIIKPADETDKRFLVIIYTNGEPELFLLNGNSYVGTRTGSAFVKGFIDNFIL